MENSCQVGVGSEGTRKALKSLVSHRQRHSILPDLGVYCYKTEMIKQRENDWNQRYRDKDTPWEEESPSIELKPILEKYTTQGDSILEVGCGLGTNAIWFAKNGYKVNATDISEECIQQAQTKNSLPNENLKFYTLDILNNNVQKQFDIVFDKGCLHSFLTQEAYNEFAKQVSGNLKDNGIWISISGNSDNPDDIEKRKALSFPRVSLRNIAFAVEPHFEVLEVKRSRFGEKNNFYCWIGVFKKRQFFYE